MMRIPREDRDKLNRLIGCLDPVIITADHLDCISIAADEFLAEIKIEVEYLRDNLIYDLNKL